MSDWLFSSKGDGRSLVTAGTVDTLRGTDLAKEAATLSEATRTEQARSLFLAGIQALPIIGGPLGSLLADILPGHKTARIVQFLQLLASDIERVKEHVDLAVVETAEYAQLFENVLAKVARLSDGEKEKLRALRAILLNTVKPSAPQEMERQFFMGLLDRLQEVHVLAISLMYDPAAFVSVRSISALDKNVPQTVEALLSACLEAVGVDAHLVEGVVIDLENMGIMEPRQRPGGQGLVVYKQKVHNRAAMEQGLKQQLTRNGRSFATFIALPICDGTSRQ